MRYGIHKYRLSTLLKVAEHRAPGYYEAVLAAGYLDGDFVLITPAVHERLCEKFRPMVGLGDMVAVVTKPIARLLDQTFGTEWVNCGGCKGRQDKLNQLVPFPAKNKR